MPSTASALHPSGKVRIDFSEEDHVYMDSFGLEYTSGTRLLHGAFAPFDAAGAAAAKSLKTGKPAAEYILEWKKFGEECAAAGTRTHENCENQILGRFDKLHTPIDEAERRRFCAAWNEVEDLQKNYCRIEPEKLVFSPRFLVAGSIDMFCVVNQNHYAIGDWKFIRKLRFEAFQHRTGIVHATRNIPDCNFFHYALQLNIYKMILKIEDYIPLDAAVDLFLKRYNFETETFEHIPLPDLSLQAMLLIAGNVTEDGLTRIPF